MVSSFEKSFHVTSRLSSGSRIFNERNQKVHQFLVFSVNSLCQVAISEYLDVVSVDGVCTRKKEITSKAFRNKSVQTPSL
jgi:methionine aminotransferase